MCVAGTPGDLTRSVTSTLESPTVMVWAVLNRQHAIAHTSPVRVLVGDEPIASAEDAAVLIDRLASQKEFYRRAAKYERPEQRDRMSEVFDSAIRKLQITERSSGHE